MKFRILIPLTGEMAKPVQAFASTLPEAMEVAVSYLSMLGVGHTAQVLQTEEKLAATVALTKDAKGQLTFVKNLLDSSPQLVGK